MKIAVVYFANRPGSRIPSFAESLAKGIETQGHQVDCIDGNTAQNAKLTIYRYLAIGTEQVSLFGRLSEKIPLFLASAGAIQGKQAFAFVAKKAVGASRALLNLMKAMEKEGMMIRFSEIILSTDHALELGKRLHIDL